jgi:hypothetical protein
MTDLGWHEPKRIRRSVHWKDRHLGYVTLVAYPNRDITAFTEGSPYREVVISDEREGHIALLQRFKAHWLIQCGECYGTTEQAREMTEELAMKLAMFALRSGEQGDRLVELMRLVLDSRG